jgi:hypothetical protein
VDERSLEESAHGFMRVGQTLNDPCCTGQALKSTGLDCTLSDDYDKALEYCEQCLAVAIAPLDRIGAAGGTRCALVLLRRTECHDPHLIERQRGCSAYWCELSLQLV